MNLKRRILFLALAACATVASAQTWPNRAIRVIMPVNSGSGADTVMRILGEHMTGQIGQPVVIDQKPGAGGVAAFQAFKNAADDHTFLFVITSTAMAPLTLKAAAAIDLARDTQPVARIAESTFILVANPKTGAKNLNDLLRMAKENPGKIAIATPFIRSLGNLAAELLVQTGGVKLNIIPFSKPSDAMAAVVSGDVQFAIDAISATFPMVKANRLQPIAVLGSRKLPGLESIPSGRDTLAGFQAVGTYGLVGQKDLSKANAQLIAKAIGSALADPSIIEKMHDAGLYARFGTPEQYQETQKFEVELWRGVVRTAGIAAE